MTLVELLMLLGVASLLMALTLPAVQSARETSRRSQCLDNLRQLGMATHNHIAIKSEDLPYTATNGADPGGHLLASISPHRKLLPFLDRSDLLSGVDEGEIIVNQPGAPPSFVNPVLEKLLGIRVSAFLCPSDVRRPGATNYRANMGYGPGVFGAQPPALAGFAGNTAGAFVHGRSTRVAEFRDGLSSTVLFSEKLIGDGKPNWYTGWTDSFYFYSPNISTADDAVQACQGSMQSPHPPHASYGGWTWLFGGWNSTWYNHVLTPNMRTPDCSEGGNAMAGGARGIYAARSFHPGGVNVVLADGSTRFVADQIDPLVWRAYSTRAGTEVYGDDW